MRYHELREAPEAYDIQARYDEFNRLYFGGELPKIPLGFAPLKGLAGVVKFSAIRSGPKMTARQIRMGYPDNLVLKPETVKLILSNKFKCSDDEYDNSLLHEMIHVYMIMVANDLRETHGSKFELMRSRISRMSGINIKRTETVTDKELNDGMLKTVGVLTFLKKDGQYAFMLISATNATSKKKEIKAWAEKLTWYESISLHTITTPVWSKIAAICPIQRVMKKFYKASPESISDLVKHGHIIFKI